MSFVQRFQRRQRSLQMLCVLNANAALRFSFNVLNDACSPHGHILRLNCGRSAQRERGQKRRPRRARAFLDVLHERVRIVRLRAQLPPRATRRPLLLERITADKCAAFAHNTRIVNRCSRPVLTARAAHAERRVRRRSIARPLTSFLCRARRKIAHRRVIDAVCLARFAVRNVRWRRFVSAPKSSSS